jgi:folate-dependent tRNA-U54 methylase TrmFO/GidA
MKANFGILPALAGNGKTGKRERGKLYAERALADLAFVIDRLMEKSEAEA